MSEYEQYEHHGGSVYVRSDLKSRHREHCLCFKCRQFSPGTVANCPIAQATFENCVKFNTTTPMWECPKFIETEQK